MPVPLPSDSRARLPSRALAWLLHWLALAPPLPSVLPSNSSFHSLCPWATAIARAGARSLTSELDAPLPVDVSTLPRRRAPSSMPMRGVTTLPSTLPDEPKSTRSAAFKFPCTTPFTTISRASISACTRPLAPIVSRPDPTRTLPCTSPSIYISELPVISPRIFSPALMRDSPPACSSIWRPTAGVAVRDELNTDAPPEVLLGAFSTAVLVESSEAATLVAGLSSARRASALTSSGLAVSRLELELATDTSVAGTDGFDSWFLRHMRSSSIGLKGGRAGDDHRPKECTNYSMRSKHCKRASQMVCFNGITRLHPARGARIRLFWSPNGVIPT